MTDLNNINQQLGLHNENKISDEEMIVHISQRVQEMLDQSPELLMSYLYRLDVLEEKIQAVMHSPKGIPIADALATLIWDRQKLRLKYRQQFRQGPINDDF